jgi:zinc protease
MAGGPLAWGESLTHKFDRYICEIQPKRGAKTFEPINTNGSQRGWRPIVHFFPERLANIKIIEGAELKPVVTDDFILVPNPRTCDTTRRYRVVFEAQPAQKAAAAVKGGAP